MSLIHELKILILETWDDKRLAYSRHPENQLLSKVFDEIITDWNLLDTIIRDMKRHITGIPDWQEKKEAHESLEDDLLGLFATRLPNISEFQALALLEAADTYNRPILIDSFKRIFTKMGLEV